MEDKPVDELASIEDVVNYFRERVEATLPHPALSSAEHISDSKLEASFLMECRGLLALLCFLDLIVEVDRVTTSEAELEVRQAVLQKFKAKTDDWNDIYVNVQNSQRDQANHIVSRALSLSHDGLNEDDVLQALETSSDVDQAFIEIFGDEILEDHSDSESDSDTHPESALNPSSDLCVQDSWQRPIFEPENSNLMQCLEVLRADEKWAFWHNLFDDLSKGSKPNFALLEKVLEIDGGIWASGIEALSEEILVLTASLLVEETDLVEELYFDEASEKIVRKTPPSANGKALELTIASIADDLDEALRGNYLSEETYVVRVLKKTITIHATNPERVEMDLVKVGKNLRSQIDKGDLPDAPEIEGLHDACVTGALDIRAHHPDIAEARNKRSLQAIREASSEERALLKESYATLREISEQSLAEDLIDDLDEIVEGRSVSPSGDVSETTDAIARSGSRLAKMWIIAKNVGSGATKAAKSVGTFSKAAQELKKLWPLLMGLLGL